jgi:hypothetical protein
VSAALHWVLWAYIYFYAFIGLFVAALLAAGLLGRCWSTVVDCWTRVPGPLHGCSEPAASARANPSLTIAAHGNCVRTRESRPTLPSAAAHAH